MPEISSKFEDCVIVVGVGLIGGSIAAAIRQRYPACEVIGVGRCVKRLAAAKAAGLLTDFTTSVTENLLQRSALVVVCLPVDLIAAEVTRIGLLAGDDVTITDAGSVKQAICKQVAANERSQRLFVGAHPIAGGEQGGFEYAEADLFAQKVCVVVDTADEARTDRVKRFWRGLECDVVTMTASEHDRTLALTSHLPHVIAAVTTSAVGPENLPMTGSGFRDVTRIAAGDSSLWRAILTGNRDEVIAAIKVAERLLADYRTALETHDDDGIESLLRAAAEHRSELDA